MDFPSGENVRFLRAEMAGAQTHIFFGRLALALAACATLACGDIGTTRPVRTGRVCRPAPGPAPAQCQLGGTDSDWLPPAYVLNSTCRCQATPNSLTANCVRGKLEATLLEVPAETRSEWQRQKVKLYDAGRHEEYERWALEVAAPELYRWHRKAQTQCCCSAALPPLAEWSTNVIENLGPCSRALALDAFGTCRDQPGRW